MAQLGKLGQRIAELQKLASIVVVNVDSTEDSRRLKKLSGIAVPVLLDGGLRVTRSYDMESREGLPMGEMLGVPTMGYVIIDPKGVVRAQRAHLFFGEDGDHMLAVLRGT